MRRDARQRHARGGWPKMTGPQKLARIRHVAALRYERGPSRQEIPGILGRSRSAVSRRRADPRSSGSESDAPSSAFQDSPPRSAAPLSSPTSSPPRRRRGGCAHSRCMPVRRARGRSGRGPAWQRVCCQRWRCERPRRTGWRERTSSWTAKSSLKRSRSGRGTKPMPADGAAPHGQDLPGQGIAVASRGAGRFRDGLHFFPIQ